MPKIYLALHWLQRAAKLIMLKPTNTQNDVNNEIDSPIPADAQLDTDEMETLQPGINTTPDSASSAADAGLIDPTVEDSEDIAMYNEMDEETPMEVPMSDLPHAEPQLHSPVMNDMDAPGEVNIEEMDEEAVRDLLPADARLDAKED